MVAAGSCAGARTIARGGHGLTAVDTSTVYYDPYDVDINADPYPTYARLREEAPAYYNERHDFWVLSRHADVEKALVDWKTFTNTRSDILDIIKADIELPPGVILFEDPPIHTMHRGLMSRVFTPRRMAALEDQVREFCVRLPRPARRLRAGSTSSPSSARCCRCG